MSTILKGGSAGKVLRRLSTVDLADHLREAREVTEDARRRAAAHVAKAQAESARAADEARRAAHEEGYRKGFEEGTASGLEQALSQARERFDREQAHLIADLQRAVAQFEAMKDELRITAQRDLLEFAVRLACKLTFAIGSVHREAVVENLKRAVDAVGRATNVAVRVHPADVATLETFAPAVLEEVGGAAHVTIQADESIAPGGCLVQTDRAEADSRLETQTEELVALLLGEGRVHD